AALRTRSPAPGADDSGCHAPDISTANGCCHCERKWKCNSCRYSESAHCSCIDHLFHNPSVSLSNARFRWTDSPTAAAAAVYKQPPVELFKSKYSDQSFSCRAVAAASAASASATHQKLPAVQCCATASLSNRATCSGSSSS